MSVNTNLNAVINPINYKDYSKNEKRYSGFEIDIYKLPKDFNLRHGMSIRYDPGTTKGDFTSFK